MTREAQIRERYERDTAAHELTVLRDDGLYRHLRVAVPRSSFYWFDLMTWPGVLMVTGDCGTFVFSRTTDMFEFFESSRGGINPQYWAEKLKAPASRHVQIYSSEAYRARVREWHEQRAEEFDGDEEAAAALADAVKEQLLDRVADFEHEARDLLADFEHDRITTGDSWEWDLREWDWSFLWCCWAIVDGVKRYRALDATETEAAAA